MGKTLNIDQEKSSINVAVLMGGPSREREISIRSGTAVSRALRSKGYQVFDVKDMDHLDRQLYDLKIQVAFVALHGQFGEDGTVQKILESCGVAYTGSDPRSSFLALHKDLAKQEFTKAGLLTPAGVSGVFRNFDDLLTQLGEIRFPVVMKPTTEGSSIGLEMVKSREDLLSAFHRIQKVSEEILIEEFIQGFELTVGILGSVALPVIRIRTDRSFYDFEAKYKPGHTEYEVPAQIPDCVYNQVQHAGLMAYEALGCRDLSRVDFLLDQTNQPWVLEVNTIPGFTETSLLPKAARAAGISFEDLCEKILQMALKRKRSHASSEAIRF